MASFSHLSKANYILLTTYRKNGTPVPTPVWFTLQNENLYIYTYGNAGKIKRIRNNSKVEIAPCTGSGTTTGDSQSATARIIPPDDPLRTQIEKWLVQKYGLLRRILGFYERLRGVKRDYLELTSA